MTKPELKSRPDVKAVSLGDLLPAAMAAVKSGKERSLSALVRQSLRFYLNPETTPPDTRPFVGAVDQLRLDLARVGSNLNQLARGFNERGPVAFDRDALARAHEDLRQEFCKVVTTLRTIEHELRGKNRQLATPGRRT